MQISGHATFNRVQNGRTTDQPGLLLRRGGKKIGFQCFKCFCNAVCCARASCVRVREFLKNNHGTGIKPCLRAHAYLWQFSRSSRSSSSVSSTSTAGIFDPKPRTDFFSFLQQNNTTICISDCLPPDSRSQVQHDVFFLNSSFWWNSQIIANITNQLLTPNCVHFSVLLFCCCCCCFSL